MRGTAANTPTDRLNQVRQSAIPRNCHRDGVPSSHPSMSADSYTQFLSLNLADMLQQTRRQIIRALFFAAHILDNPALRIRHEDMHVHGFGLPEAPAPPNALVILFVTIADADK